VITGGDDLDTLAQRLCVAVRVFFPGFLRCPEAVSPVLDVFLMASHHRRPDNWAARGDGVRTLPESLWLSAASS